jgi:cytochrome P450
MSSAAITLIESHQPIPKEKGLPLLGCLPEFARSPLDFFSKLSNNYSDVVEFSLPMIDMALVINGDIAHQILVKEVKSFRKADRDVQIMGTILGKGLVTNNHTEHHRIQRKLVQPGFHFRKIEAYADTMSDYTSQYVSDWTSGTRNISDDMFKLTMYIVTKTLFDTDMDKMVYGADQIGQTMHTVQTAINSKFNQVFLPPDWLPTPNNIKLKRARKQLNDTIQDIIDTRMREMHAPDSETAFDKRVISLNKTNDKGDMLSMLLQAKYEDGSSMDTQLVMDELITLFVAGHETTSNALTWSFYLLAKNPLIQQKLHMELDQVLGEQDAGFEHINSLVYTEMVIKEAMRMLPPVWTLSNRQANKDIVIGDYLFPKDKVIFISPYANHHNPRYFKEPSVFDPERFSIENEKKIPKHVYIPFGSGPRVCIGQSFAMMEAKIILATIMRRFSFTPGNDQNFDPQAQITLSNKNGMRVNIADRT